MSLANATSQATAFSSNKQPIDGILKSKSTTMADLTEDQAFENTSTNVAASQMRNALNKLADSVTNPEEKKVRVPRFLIDIICMARIAVLRVLSPVVRYP